jgi:surfeit locus 1 family protein
VVTTRRARLRSAALLLALLLIVGFAALGRWQLQRAEAKQAMLGQVAEVLAVRRFAPLRDAMEPARSRDYAWAAGSGRFADAPVLLLDNQRRGQAVGVRVLAPFRPAGGGLLLVDLGWLPLPGDRRLPSPVLPAGEVGVRGLLAPLPAAGLALGPGHVAVDSGRWLLTRVDADALATALREPLAPRMLRLDPALPLGFARDLEVLPNTLPPERHRGYALQWFGLAVATLLTALFLAFRPRHR